MYVAKTLAFFSPRSTFHFIHYCYSLVISEGHLIENPKVLPIAFVIKFVAVTQGCLSLMCSFCFIHSRCNILVSGRLYIDYFMFHRESSFFVHRCDVTKSGRHLMSHTFVLPKHLELTLDHQEKSNITPTNSIHLMCIIGETGGHSPRLHFESFSFYRDVYLSSYVSLR